MRGLPARRAAGSSDHTGSAESAGRYGLLLVLLIVTYLLSASPLSTLAEDISAVLFLGVLLLALRTARVSRRTARLVAAVALLGSIAATIAVLSTSSDAKGAADIWKGLVLLLTAVLIVRRVLARPTVTEQSIYGALSAYLIIGLMFAAFYAAFGHFGGAPQHDFFVDKQPANPQTFQYFSFTTLTTLGYGDFTADGDSGRALAVLEALTGQVFLAILVARLVAAYRAPAAPPPPASGRHVPPGTVWRGPATRRPKPAASVRRTVSRPKEPPGRRAP